MRGKLLVGLIISIMLLTSFVMATDEYPELPETAPSEMSARSSGIVEPYCHNADPSVFPSGVAAGTIVTLHGPSAPAGQTWTYSWIVKQHISKTSVSTLTDGIGTAKDITFTVPLGAARIDAFLTVTNGDSKLACQLELCDWFWVNYDCPIQPDTFCETREGRAGHTTYDYNGPTAGMTILFGTYDWSTHRWVEWAWNTDPWTASFTNPAMYPVGTYWTYFYRVDWNGGVHWCGAPVTIIAKPTGSIT